MTSEVRAPLAVAAYLALDANTLRRAGRIEQLAQTLARSIARVEPRRSLRFGEVSVREWAAVRRMRRRVYEDSLPVLLTELDAHDQDRYDAHSFLFAAWLDDKPIATIRCTTYPYETLRYVDATDLGRYLGPGWEREYFEWGRMAMDRAHRGRRLMPALLLYASLLLVASTPYRKYLGYTRAGVRSRLRGFRIQDDSFTFRIPERGEHDYTLLRGDAGLGLAFAVPKAVASTLATAFNLIWTSAFPGAQSS